MKKDQIFVAIILGFLMTLMVTSAQAGTTITNIVDTETNLLIGQKWTDNESGENEYVYVDKTDRQLFVVNQGRYKELVKTRTYGETTDTTIVHMGDAGMTTMSTAAFIEASGESTFEAAVARWEEIQNGDQGGVNKDDHMIERKVETQVDRQSSMKLTPAMVAKLNAKIKQYKESE